MRESNLIPSPDGTSYPPSALVVPPSSYCSPRSSLSETALATAICSTSSSSCQWRVESARIIASATHLRGQVFVVGVGVESPSSNTARYCLLNYLSTTDNIKRQFAKHERLGRTTPVTRSAATTRAQSLSPAPLRTPLRLLPRQESLLHSHDLAHVRPRPTNTTLPLTTNRHWRPFAD